MTAPLAAYNFDEATGPVVDYGASGAYGFSLTGTDTNRVAGHTLTGLRSTGAVSAVLPDVGRTPSRTVMAWLAFSGIVTSWPILFNVASLDSGGWGILYLAPDIAIQARNTSTFVRASVAWPTDGQPHHVAGTYDGSAVRLYLDGVLQGSPVALTGPLRTDTDPPKLWSGTGSMSSGYLDDLRIYDAALGAGEIAAAMATPVTALVEPAPEPEPEPEPEPSPAPILRAGGWEGLHALYQLAVEEQRVADETAPLACPNDGEPLSTDPEGNLRCGWDGWVWDGQPVRY